MDFTIPKESGEDEVPMAPMIDMVFLLLIFFMVASHINQLEKVEIEVPVAENAKVPDELGDRRTVTIKEDGTIYLGTLPVDIEEVEPEIREHRKKVPGLKVYLRADKRLDHGEVRKVMEKCAAAGAAEIIFATYETE